MPEGVILYLLLFLSEEECQEKCLKIKLWGSCSSLLRVGSLSSLQRRKRVWCCTSRWRLKLFFFFLPSPQEAFDSLGLRCWLFSAHFCCPEDWGCHPDKTKTPLQCKYLQDIFTWSFRDILLSLQLLLQTSLMPSPSLPSLPSLPLDDTQKKNIVIQSGLQGPTWQWKV